ncbi:hypothetical protein OPV22_007225 [Ensete ventricosum]|uniref:Uncharacterized protein n=1 Tax=Ensete ventricosum TaxID=4639 RepID=A0AAV8RRC4_ENSVE|nr:hypothetical protein OPV22_007225 [Ensete ventricosum]
MACKQFKAEAGPMTPSPPINSLFGPPSLPPSLVSSSTQAFRSLSAAAKAQKDHRILMGCVVDRMGWVDTDLSLDRF